MDQLLTLSEVHFIFKPQDNLAADVRVETERRFKALEADLHEAESAKKERALAVRYHKVKFFGGVSFTVFFCDCC